MEKAAADKKSPTIEASQTAAQRLTVSMAFTTLPPRSLAILQGDGLCAECAKAGASDVANKPQDSNGPRFGAAGLEIGVGVGLGVLIGYWIDRKFNCQPWGMLAGAALGFASGMYLLIKEAMRANKDR